MNPPTFSLDSLLDLARRQNPAIVALRSRERAAALNVKVAQAAYTPTLNLSTGWGGNSYQYTDADFLVNQARGSVLGQHGRLLPAGLDPHARRACRPATATRAMPFTDAQAAGDPRAEHPVPVQVPAVAARALGAAVDPAVRQLQPRGARAARRRRARRRRSTTSKAKELALTADVTQAYLTLKTAAQTVALQEQNATKAQEELAFAEERYKVGASTFLDVITSRGTYEQALIDRVNAVYDYHKAFAALENAVGHPLR